MGRWYFYPVSVAAALPGWERLAIRSIVEMKSGHAA
jgi:hypothetical protein